jgi:hypothetical protein
MQKNVTGQKLIVFAFDSTTSLPVSGDAANLTAYVSKDYGTVTVLATRPRRRWMRQTQRAITFST